MVVLNPSDHDYVEIHEFIVGMDGLEQYPVHFYKIMVHYFGNSFFLVRQEHRIVGLAWGITSQKNKDIFFLWQIGVLPEFRGRNIARLLMDKVIEFAAEQSCKKIHTTTEPSNVPSWKLFDKLGFQNVSKGSITESEGIRAMVNYYGSGSSQVFFELPVKEKSRQLPG